jgi:glycosyltransferase involved in cell wall biosynthesis
MTPMVSIIVCTRNRAQSLLATVETIGRCKIPEDLPSELLIVDNGSTDETADAVRQIHPPNIPLRYIFEPEAGQSRARNRGLVDADGGILLFTDDDVRVPPDWIEGMCRPILSGAADAVAGGVRFPVELDRRLKVCRSWFASTEAILSDRPDRFVGANMAFSRDVLGNVPAFDVELGPGASGFGDETLFCFQLRAAGFRLVTRFDVAVEHHLDPARLTRARLIEMARQMGRSKAYIAHHWRHAESPGRHGIPILDVARLWTRRLAQFRKSSAWELKMIETTEMRRQFLRETGRPHNYAKHGLVKLHGDLPASPHLVR